MGGGKGNCKMFKFGVDAMLGKIAKILRFYGFDTKYFRDKKDMEILAECIRDGRVLITSDEGLYNLGKGWNLKAVYIKYPYKDPWDIAKEIIRSLGARPEPFTRCPRCNGVLNKVSKWDIEGFGTGLRNLRFAANVVRSTGKERITIKF